MRACLVYTTSHQPEESLTGQIQTLAQSLQGGEVEVDTFQLTLNPIDRTPRGLVREVKAIAATATLQTAWQNVAANLAPPKPGRLSSLLPQSSIQKNFLLLDLRRTNKTVSLTLFGLIAAARAAKFNAWRIFAMVDEADFRLIRSILKIPADDLVKQVSTTSEGMRLLLQKRSAGIRFAEDIEYDARRCERRYGSRYVDDFD